MTAPAVPPPLTVGLISLGCAKNLVDAEIMLGALLREGFQVVSDPTRADAVIVNTCSFIDAAQEESVDTILESAQVRDVRRRHQALIVAGCLAQRFREQLPGLFPEVDAFMGIDQVAQVSAIVREAVTRRRQRLAAPTPPRRRVSARSATGQSTGSRPRGRAIVGRLDALAPLAAQDGPRPALTLSGTGKQGQTRTVLGIPTATTGPVAPAAGWAGLPPLVQIQARPRYIPDYTTPRFRLTPRHSAYVKIAEGCNHPCSFCTIPRMRGAHRSRQQADVVEEARRLLDDGVRELNLISQDSTFYGLDLRSAAGPTGRGAPTIATLLRELDALPGEFWIRLLYTHPAHWTDELIRTMAECRKVARYVDIPLQHIHDDVLARMRRETSEQQIVDLLGRIRAGVPGIALRTTFIVGFPGETEAHFDRLLAFVRQVRFERLGVFTYSQEQGTIAGRLPDQVPDRVKRARRDALMAVQQTVARAVAHAMVGRSIRVLVEGPAPDKPAASAEPAGPGVAREHGQTHLPQAAPPGGPFHEPLLGSVSGSVSVSGSQSHSASPSSTSNTDSGSDPDPDRSSRQFMAPGRVRPNNEAFHAACVARGEADAPDIDGRVFLRTLQPAGEFARVRVVGHTDYDLYAE